MSACLSLLSDSIQTLRLRYLFMCAVLLSVAMPFDVSANETHKFTYSIQWANFKLAKSVAEWRFTETSLEMTGTVVPEGKLSSWSDSSGDVWLSAKRTSSGWQAERLELKSREGDERRNAVSHWSDDGQNVQTLRTPEPEADLYHPITPDMQKRVTAPFLAMIEMLEALEAGHPCNGSFEIYDGWRRAQLRFKDKGKTVLEADRPGAYAGEAHQCQLVLRPIGGHQIKPRFGRKRDVYDNVMAFVGRDKSGRLVPVRIEVDVMLGRMIARLEVN